MILSPGRKKKKKKKKKKKTEKGRKEGCFWIVLFGAALYGGKECNEVVVASALYLLHDYY